MLWATLANAQQPPTITLINGDIDGDNEVTLFDHGILVANFGLSEQEPGFNPEADLDGDTEVTLFDFGILVNHFGEIGLDALVGRGTADGRGFERASAVAFRRLGWSSEPCDLAWSFVRRRWARRVTPMHRYTSKR
ncbi:MAG: hypothetical protein KatS3mg022_2407 [Armatimonadota bacterium]|nr:MAG: hypothetical protein KatS3mg022_2407 [Armatimonadota bacterium]